MTIAEREPEAAIGFRLVLVLYTALVVLSFLPWYSGTEAAAGYADHLFNGMRLSGWRVDFLVLLAVGALSSSWSAKIFSSGRREDKGIDRVLGVILCVELFAFVTRSLLTFHIG